MDAQELVGRIKGSDDKARGKAWQQAGPVGAGAVKALAGVAAQAEMEIARAATRALWAIVRYAGRPGADADRQAVVSELLAALAEQTAPRVRSDLIWMISELGGDESVAPIAALLSDATLREDARMALERIEGDASLSALKNALPSAPQEFRPNLAHSLRKRGVTVPDVPSLRLKPVKSTQVKAVS